MRGLTVLLVEGTPARLRAALTLAAAQAALGGRARLFVDAAAVPALRRPPSAADDAAHAAAGLPTLAALLEEALATGVELLLCQTGLHLAGLDAAMFDPRCGFGGLVAVMQSLGDDRLVAV